jgi:hypothetical protein
VGVPPTRSQQIEDVTLDAPDSYVRVTLPDGRIAELYGTGQLNVIIGLATKHHRLPQENESTTVAPARSARRRGRAV